LKGGGEVVPVRQKIILGVKSCKDGTQKKHRCLTQPFIGRCQGGPSFAVDAKGGRKGIAHRKVYENAEGRKNGWGC